MPPARTGTASPRAACAVSKPARACAIRSYAGASASGPDVPNELMRPTTSAGHAAWTSSQSSPNRLRALAREVVQHDVSPSKEPSARREPVVALEVEHDRALAPVQRHEVAPDLRRDRHDVPIAVAPGRLDLDDVRAQVGEENATQRPGDVLRVLDDPNTCEGKAHRRPNPRRAMTVCKISAEPPEIVEPTDER